MVTVLQAPLSPTQAAASGVARGLQQGFLQRDLQQVMQQSQGLSAPEQAQLVLSSNLPPDVKNQLLQNLQYQQRLSLQEKGMEQEQERFQQRLALQERGMGLQEEKFAFEKGLIQKKEKREEVSRQASQAFMTDIFGIADRKAQELEQLPPDQITPEQVNEVKGMVDTGRVIGEGYGTPEYLRRKQIEIMTRPDLTDEDRRRLNNSLELIKPKPLSIAEGVESYRNLTSRGLSPDFATLELYKNGLDIKEAKNIREMIDGPAPKSLDVQAQREKAKKENRQRFKDQKNNLFLDSVNVDGFIEFKRPEDKAKIMKNFGKIVKQYIEKDKKIQKQFGEEYDPEELQEALEIEKESLRLNGLSDSDLQDIFGKSSERIQPPQGELRPITEQEIDSILQEANNDPKVAEDIARRRGLDIYRVAGQ